MSNVAKTIKREFAELIPTTIYFFVILHLVAFIRALMTEHTGVDISTTTSITVAALILGKAVLIANAMPFINRYPREPLIWNVAWKTGLYFLVALVMHYLEHLYDYWKVAPGFMAANQKLISELVWPHFWAIQILLALLILLYCVIVEMARVIGRDKLKAMFFGPLPVAPTGK